MQQLTTLHSVAQSTVEQRCGIRRGFGTIIVNGGIAQLAQYNTSVQEMSIMLNSRPIRATIYKGLTLFWDFGATVYKSLTYLVIYLFIGHLVMPLCCRISALWKWCRPICKTPIRCNLRLGLCNTFQISLRQWRFKAR